MSTPIGLSERKNAAQACLDDMFQWLKEDGQVGIFDATNSTKERRDWIIERCHAETFQVLFVESICTIPEVIATNIHMTKINSPEYENVSQEEAAADFLARLKNYEKDYQTLGDDDDLSYIKLIDVGRQIVVNHVRGYLPGRIVGLLMNVHTGSRPIYLARHGQTIFNAEGRLGGDSSLTKTGRKYARRLARFMRQEVSPGAPLQVWTSTLSRTHETAAPLKRKYMQWRALDEIDCGLCDGMSYDEIESKYPEMNKERRDDILRWRYPRGESYLDLIGRLEPVFIGLERQQCPVVVVAHHAVLRVIACYFGDKSPEQVPDFVVTPNTVLKLTPQAYGCNAEAFELLPGPQGVDGVPLVHPLDR